MVRTFCESNLISNVDEVGSEAKLGHSAESDEYEEVRVILRLEGGHLGGGRERGLVGRRNCESL